VAIASSLNIVDRFSSCQVSRSMRPNSDMRWL